MPRKILKAVHKMAKGLTKASVMDKQTMREFDALCLPPVKHYTKREIKRIRERQNASQAVFASYLQHHQRFEAGNRERKSRVVPH